MFEKMNFECSLKLYFWTWCCLPNNNLLHICFEFYRAFYQLSNLFNSLKLFHEKYFFLALKRKGMMFKIFLQCKELSIKKWSKWVACYQRTLLIITLSLWKYNYILLLLYIHINLWTDKYPTIHGVIKQLKIWFNTMTIEVLHSHEWDWFGFYF